MDYLVPNALNKRLYLLNTIRLSIIAVLAILYIFVKIFLIDFKNLSVFFTGIFLISLVSGFYAFFKIKEINLILVVNILIIEDIVLISLIVYITGGSISPFYFLYIIPIFVSSIFLSKRNTVFIGGFAFVIFGSISELMYLNVLPSSPIIKIESIDFRVFVYNVLMALIAFIILGYLFSSLFEKIEKKEKELKNVQESLKDIKTFNNIVIENIEVGVITISDKGKILYKNKRGNEIKKTNFVNLLYNIINEIENNNDETFKYYKEIEYENKFYGISISIINNIYSLKRIYVFLIADLTKEKVIEKKLKQKEHLALIGEMAAGIAHELRNPLASISGSVQYINKQLKLNDEYKKLMDIIVAESMRLSSTIEDFLNITKSYELKKTQFDFSNLVQDIVKLLENENKEIKFIKNVEKGLNLFADEKRIKEILWNLLTNSIKAVLKVKSPLIEVSAIKKTKHIIELSIKDNGIGMESEELNKIFTPFYSKFTSGVGLGLFLVKRIIDEHGYDIKVISSKGVGTEVLIWMKI